MSNKESSRSHAEEGARLTRPSYHSLFDQLDYAKGENLTYQGTLRGVIGELHEELGSASQEQESLLKQVLHPPRIIRSVLDDKIQNPHTQSIELMLQAIDLGLAVYVGSSEAESKLREFEIAVAKTEKEYLLDLPLRQVHDKTTYKVMNPIYSRKSTLMLAEHTGGKPVLFVALAHGAVGAGMDILLRYREEVGEYGEESEGSMFYLVRNSRAKMHDRNPKITDEEISFLQNAHVGRELVVFDHSINTGQTLLDTAEFLRTRVSHAQPITLTNNNQWDEVEIDVEVADTSHLSDM